MVKYLILANYAILSGIHSHLVFFLFVYLFITLIDDNIRQPLAIFDE